MSLLDNVDVRRTGKRSMNDLTMKIECTQFNKEYPFNNEHIMRLEFGLIFNCIEEHYAQARTHAEKQMLHFIYQDVLHLTDGIDMPYMKVT